MAICPTVMFRLSSEVVTATASQLSIPALRRFFKSMGNPTEVTPPKSASSCAILSSLSSITATSCPAASSISATLRPKRPPPMTRIFIHVPVPFLPGSLRALISLCRGRETAGNACTAPAADFPILNPDGVPFPAQSAFPWEAQASPSSESRETPGAVVALLSGALESGASELSSEELPSEELSEEPPSPLSLAASSTETSFTVT